ncbi:hypothetical protein T440DRAFT_245583 [Plenodomus tracheiphilus IPT5]|uniref:Uncharacterized protein n=1 Tax=Plenodomus tracheiphilus IPT5 TaxID=1408161 RepID=A0A6A7BKD4_9PLEO|nr:hypothetical protein T440DRAFT_245583 [Plenodomus tracheiphilus IPT5]
MQPPYLHRRQPNLGTKELSDGQVRYSPVAGLGHCSLLASRTWLRWIVNAGPLPCCRRLPASSPFSPRRNCIHAIRQMRLKHIMYIWPNIQQPCSSHSRAGRCFLD